MEWWSAQSSLVMAILLLGAALGTIIWSRPSWFKVWGLLVLTATWLAVAIPSWMSDAPLTISGFLTHLILLTGLVITLGQRSNNETPISIFLLLLFTGFGLGYLTSEGQTGTIVLGGHLGLLILVIVRHRGPDREIPWYAIGVLAIGVFSSLLSFVTSDLLRILSLLLPLAIVWPLLPLQGAFVSSITYLPGMVPAFLAVLLPSLGFYGFTNLLPGIPEGVLTVLGVVAIGSALYGSLLALRQNSMNTLLAYAQVALGSILWWYVTLTQSAGQGTVSYLAGLSLVLCGLLLADRHLRARFGHLGLDKSYGLAYTMPRFSVLFVLFITAGIGLPMFTVFSGFMEMMLGHSSILMGNLAIVLLVWLMASWYFPRLMQQVLFGSPSSLSRVEYDLHGSEQLSLVLLLVFLVIIGVAPFYWFGTTDHAVPLVQLSFGISQDEIWIR